MLISSTSAAFDRYKRIPNNWMFLNKHVHYMFLRVVDQAGFVGCIACFFGVAHHQMAVFHWDFLLDLWPFPVVTGTLEWPSPVTCGFASSESLLIKLSSSDE